MTPREVADLRRWLDASEGIADGKPFLGDRRLDALVDVLLETAAQLWVAKRRGAMLESLLVEKGVFTPDELEQHLPSAADAAALRAARGEFVGTIFRSLAELPLEPTPEDKS
jgi:hypothetical protein